VGSGRAGATRASAERSSASLGRLLDDDVRSCFALSEPEAASSDPTNIFTTATLAGDEWYALYGGVPSSLAGAAAWIIGLLALFIPLCVWRYRRMS
jgi:alkylation response protein AidB-like acyl-CoA dehydrogenase